MDRNGRGQNDNSSTEESRLMRAASIVATSTSPGSTPNTLAIVFFVCSSVSTISPPLRPTSAVEDLKVKIANVEELYKEHKIVLDRLAGPDGPTGLDGLAVFEAKAARYDMNWQYCWLA